MPSVSDREPDAREPGAAIVTARVDPSPHRQLEALSELLQQSDARQQRAAAELHDHALQMLTATLVLLDAAERKSAIAGIDAAEIGAARNAAAQVMERVLRVAFDLCPQLVHALGLRDGLRGVAERTAAETGWTVTVTGDTRRLPPESEALAFGAGCEAIDNARRHANAQAVSVEMTVNQGWLTLTVADDGVGFTLCRGAASGDGRSLGGLELTAQPLHTAGGRLVVDSAPGQGTRVAVWLPV